MMEKEGKLDELKDSFRQLKKAFDILFFLITTGERGQTIYDSLKKVGPLVRDLNDERLTNLYNKLFAVFLTRFPHQQIDPDDYVAFLQRLGSLTNEASVLANKADIALREIIGLQSVIGIWGGMEWLPLSHP